MRQETSKGGEGINIEGVEVTFPNGYVGLKSTNLSIPGGKFCTLLGPSGSGKTTLLRTIAGLVAPTDGRIIIGNRDVTKLPIQARNIGFVFQNYALFPNMTVAQNIEYPLKLQKLSMDEREVRVQEILELVELPHLANRGVGELSGGQQQRVAIGRALSYRPSLLLLDEPMGALDRRLRQQLGAELRSIQQRTGITAVYVTHDQEEAFILSDKIAIMDRGEILQYSTPTDLYFRPQSRFVAEFLGETNLIDVNSLKRNEQGSLLAATNYGTLTLANKRDGEIQGTSFTIVIRPEDIFMSDSPKAGPEFATPISVKILQVLFLGSRCLITVQAADGKKFLIESVKSKIPATESTVWITWKLSESVLISS